MDDIHPPFELHSIFALHSYGLVFWVTFLIGCSLIILIWYGVLIVRKYRNQKQQEQILIEQERALSQQLLDALKGLDPKHPDFFLTLQYLFRDLLSAHYRRDARSATIEEIVTEYQLSDDLTGIVYQVRDAYYLGSSTHDPHELHTSLVANILKRID